MISSMNHLSKDSFAFLVLVYNQEQYVIEHLESIKFLVIEYGSSIDVDLLINDDGSKDNSCGVIDQWLEHNNSIFRNVETLYNKVNLGTCKSVSNLLEKNQARRCKITAADDVYSYENIFELTKYDDEVALVSGFPLFLIDNKLSSDSFNNAFMYASQLIYDSKNLLTRFKSISISNAPNILYSGTCLKDPRVIEYLNKFLVTEDWPIQLAIGKYFPDFSFQLVEKVFVYYRRTSNSTYLVSHNRFSSDKVSIFNDLIETEESVIFRARLRIRKMCFTMNNLYLFRLLNIDYYIFFLKSLYLSRPIKLRLSRLDLEVQKHQLHLNEIANKSRNFYLKSTKLNNLF